MERIKTAIRNPARIYDWLSGFGLTNWVSDEAHLKLMWKSVFGPDASLDLDSPSTFNEKLQWLKLHDRNPLYTTLVDKYAVKQWVADRIGPEYVTETYAKWDRVEDVDTADLPDKFVLKTNHDCGGIAICRDRSSFDLDAAKRKLAKHMRRNYFYGGREWPYKDVKPCVFAEEYLASGESGDLADYKLFRFTDGRLITLVCEDRLLGAGMKKTFFDEEWRILPCSEGGHPVNPGCPRPRHLEQMVEFAKRLGEGMPFVRVDFYESSNRLYFGEMTFYPNSGFERFDPADWDERLGEWVDLSEFAPGGGVAIRE